MPQVPEFGPLFTANGKHNSEWLKKCLPLHMVEFLHYQFAHGPRRAKKKAQKKNPTHWLSEIQVKDFGLTDYFQTNSNMKKRYHNKTERLNNRRSRVYCMSVRTREKNPILL